VCIDAGAFLMQKPECKLFAEIPEIDVVREPFFLIPADFIKPVIHDVGVTVPAILLNDDGNIVAGSGQRFRFKILLHTNDASLNLLLIMVGKYAMMEAGNEIVILLPALRSRMLRTSASAF
jgi:hypothetical protein